MFFFTYFFMRRKRDFFGGVTIWAVGHFWGLVLAYTSGAFGSKNLALAGHMSPKILEILIVSKWRLACDWLILWSCDLLFARVFFAPPF